MTGIKFDKKVEKKHKNVGPGRPDKKLGSLGPTIFVDRRTQPEREVLLGRAARFEAWYTMLPRGVSQVADEGRQRIDKSLLSRDYMHPVDPSEV